MDSLKKGRRFIASIQARMGSARLPNKVLKEVAGKPLLQIMIERANKSVLIDDLIVATTLEPRDDAIVDLCKDLGVNFFRGSEDGVLERMYLTHKEISTDVVVSLYGDCPLIDPKIIDTVIVAYIVNQPCDYVTNLDSKTYPTGMGLEVYPFRVLELAYQKVNTSEDREHSSRYFRIRPHEFKHVHVGAPPELYYPQLEIALDEDKDYELIKILYEALHSQNPYFGCKDIVDYIKLNNHLLDINQKVKRRELKR